MGTDVLPERGCGLCAQAEPLEPRLLLSTIGGGVWEDLDGDGLWDVGEEGLSGWTVYIDVDKNGRRDAGESYQVTGADGGYAFSGLGPGSYWVTEEAPDGWVQSYPDSLSAPRTFTNVNAALPGLYETSIDWGDYDNDGDLDLYFTTVYGTASFDKKNHPVLYRNDGAWVFADATSPAGLAEQPPTYQAAWADFDRDGDLDLATAGKLYVNEGNGNHWIEVRLDGSGASFNRAAIGAQVRIRLEDRVPTRQVEAGTGEGNQNDLTLHFGLADHGDPVDLEIRWPDGTAQVVPGQPVDRLLTVRTPPAAEDSE